MSALRALIFAMLAFACAPLAAQDDRFDEADKAQAPVRYSQGNPTWGASSETASKNFWRWIVCIAERKPTEVDGYLYGELEDDERYKGMRKFWRENTSCLDSGASRMQWSSILFEGGLGGLRLADRYAAGEMPDYSGIPTRFPAATFSTIESGEARRHFLMLMFAECVVRSDPASVFGLLRTDLFSKEASPYWSALGETMGYCVPAEDGDALAFQAFELRIFFGYAALELDKARNSSRLGVLSANDEATE